MSLTPPTIGSGTADVTSRLTMASRYSVSVGIVDKKLGTDLTADYFAGQPGDVTAGGTSKLGWADSFNIDALPMGLEAWVTRVAVTGSKGPMPREEKTSVAGSDVLNVLSLYEAWEAQFAQFTSRQLSTLAKLAGKKDVGVGPVLSFGAEGMPPDPTGADGNPVIGPTLTFGAEGMPPSPAQGDPVVELVGYVVTGEGVLTPSGLSGSRSLTKRAKVEARVPATKITHVKTKDYAPAKKGARLGWAQAGHQPWLLSDLTFYPTLEAMGLQPVAGAYPNYMQTTELFSTTFGYGYARITNNDFWIEEHRGYLVTNYDPVTPPAPHLPSFTYARYVSDVSVGVPEILGEYHVETINSAEKYEMISPYVPTVPTPEYGTLTQTWAGGSAVGSWYGVSWNLDATRVAVWTQIAAAMADPYELPFSWVYTGPYTATNSGLLGTMTFETSAPIPDSPLPFSTSPTLDRHSPIWSPPIQGTCRLVKHSDDPLIITPETGSYGTVTFTATKVSE